MMCLSRKCAEPNRSSPRTTTTMLNWEEGKKKRNLEDKKKQNKQKEKKTCFIIMYGPGCLR